MDYSPHHLAISVRNLEASLKFYQALGFTQVYHYYEPDGSMSITHLKLGTLFLEIFTYLKNRTLEPLHNEYANNIDKIGVKHLALTTDNIGRALNDLRSKGMADKETTIEASETGKAWWFFIKDPDGVWVEIIKDDRYS